MITYLPMREWLELGQAITDLRWLPPKYFRAHHVELIEIFGGCSIDADGKVYAAGRYRLYTSPMCCAAQHFRPAPSSHPYT